MKKYEVAFAFGGQRMTEDTIHTRLEVEAENSYDAVMRASAARVHALATNYSCYGPAGDSRVALVTELIPQQRYERATRFSAF